MKQDWMGATCITGVLIVGWVTANPTAIAQNANPELSTTPSITFLRHSTANSGLPKISTSTRSWPSFLRSTVRLPTSFTSCGTTLRSVR